MDLSQVVDSSLIQTAQKVSGISDARIVIENALRSYIVQFSNKPALNSPERKALLEKLTGSLHNYANPDLVAKESDAWPLAVQEKYDTN